MAPALPPPGTTCAGPSRRRSRRPGWLRRPGRRRAAARRALGAGGRRPRRARDGGQRAARRRALGARRPGADAAAARRARAGLGRGLGAVARPPSAALARPRASPAARSGRPASSRPSGRGCSRSSTRSTGAISTQSEARWPGDVARRRLLSLFREGEPKRLRAGLLAVLASRRADVATPWDGPIGEALGDLSVLRGRALHARPTPVFGALLARRRQPGARGAAAGALGPAGAPSASRWPRSRGSPSTPRFRVGFQRRPSPQPRAARRAGAGARGLPRSTPDCARRSAAVDQPPQERPLLNVLGLVREHLRVTAGGWTPPCGRTVRARGRGAAAGSGSSCRPWSTRSRPTRARASVPARRLPARLRPADAAARWSRPRTSPTSPVRRARAPPARARWRSRCAGP